MSPEVQRRIDPAGSWPPPLQSTSGYRPGLRRGPAKIVERRVESLQVISETLFTGALLRERKRMDRSGRAFALLLVSVADNKSVDPLLLWGSIAEALGAAKRNTDILGWYRAGTVLGVVLTEIDSCDTAVISGIEGRVFAELRRRLDDRAVASLAIELHAHPDLIGAWKGTSAHAGPFRRGLHQRERRGQTYAALKQVIDFVGGLGLLAVLSPLFLLIAVLVKLSSKGPVFFRQVRVGEQAKPFEMLKFRTMFADADETVHREVTTRFITSRSSGVHPATTFFKMANDPRITRLGRVLRRTSLDELPQLWNVVRGDMSLVGPRPPLAYEVANYQPWHHRRVLEAKPGITGPWQVAGRSRTTFDDMVRLDLRYAKGQSLWADIKILLATPGAVVSGRGAV